MTENPNTTARSTQSGRGLGWTGLVVGILLCLGAMVTLTGQFGMESSDGAVTAGIIAARVVAFAVGIAAIVFGAKRLRR